jgi:hypothetical protein
LLPDSSGDVNALIPDGISPASLAEGTDSDLADALHAISHFTSLIHNADAKAGLGAAAIAGLLAIASQQSDSISAALDSSTRLERAALLVLVAFATALLVTAVAIGYALIPRTPVGAEGGRFSYPTVARDDWRFGPADRAAAATEAWAQARTLARITRRKFAGVKVALIALGFAFVLCGVWTAIAAAM